MMKVRFKKKSEIFDVLITAIAAVLSVGTMLYAVWHFGLRESWPELVLDLFYIACLVMMWMFFFKYRITPHAVQLLVLCVRGCHGAAS